MFQQELSGRWMLVLTIFGERPRFLTIPASSSFSRMASRDFLLLNLLRIMFLLLDPASRLTPLWLWADREDLACAHPPQPPRHAQNNLEGSFTAVASKIIFRNLASLKRGD
jgi:hypothetical protein